MKKEPSISTENWIPKGDQIYTSFRKMVKKHIPIAEESPFTPDKTYNDAFNDLTNVASNRELPNAQKQAVQMWAGSLIDAYIIARQTNRRNVFWENTTIPVQT